MKKAEMVRSINQVGFKLRKCSPEIMVIGGVIGGITAAVMACKATTKVSAIIDDTKEKVEIIHDTMANEDLIDRGEYSEADGRNALRIVYMKAGLNLAKLYGPSVIVGSASVASILTSNNILRKRNVALAAAYATIDKGFKEYRERVADRFGREVEKEIRYNLKAEQFEETTTDAKGKEKVVKKKVEVTGLEDYSMYAKFFDASSPNWEKNAEYNMMFLKREEQYANDVLVATGHLFLNDVYKRLGIPETKAGQVVGWRYDAKNPTGDNYVDFGIFETNKPSNRDFVNGYEPVILLDFNVDGNIWDNM